MCSLGRRSLNWSLTCTWESFYTPRYLNLQETHEKVKHTVNFNLANFKEIRHFLTVSAAKTYLYGMKFSHIEYCLTNWSFAGTTILKPFEQLLHKAIKIFAGKPSSYLYCNILAQYNLLNFENFKTLKSACFLLNSA